MEKMKYKKMLLINVTPPTLRGLFPDNGLALLASCLNEKNIDLEIIDYCSLENMKLFFSNNLKENLEKIIEDISSRIEKENIFHIGSKLFINGFSESIYVMERLKQNFGNRITAIGGGPQVDYFWNLFDSEGLFYEEGRKSGAFDNLVINEGEITLPALVKSKKEDWNKIPNLIYKENGKIVRTLTKRVEDLNSLPFPSYDSENYPSIKEDKKIKFINTRLNWGCFFAKCKFCFHPVKSGYGFKEKTTERIIEEIKYISRKVNTTAFRLGASSVSTSINDLAKKLIEANLNIKYSMFGNISLADKYDFKLLKESGCLSIFYGAESGNQKELDLYDKRIKVNQIEEAVKKTEENKIRAMLSFIYLGNEKAGEETLNLILRSKPSAISILPLAIMPHTPFAYEVPSNIYLGENYFKDFMRQRVNLTKPKDEWWNLDCEINGKNSRQLVRESMLIEHEAEAEGIPCRITDETFVLSHYSDKTAVEIRNLEAEFKPNGNYSELIDEIRKINRKMSI